MIQPRTSLSNFGDDSIHFFKSLLTYHRIDGLRSSTYSTHALLSVAQRSGRLIAEKSLLPWCSRFCVWSVVLQLYDSENPAASALHRPHSQCMHNWLHSSAPQASSRLKKFIALHNILHPKLEEEKQETWKLNCWICYCLLLCKDTKTSLSP